MDSTITVRVIRALDTEVESVGWRSLLLGQKIITDTSNKITNWKIYTIGTNPKSNIKKRYRKPMGKSRINNPEKLAILVHKTQDEDKQN
jgi:hypothetical protein